MIAVNLLRRGGGALGLAIGMSASAYAGGSELCPQPLSIPGASCPPKTLYTVKPPKGEPKVTPFFISESDLDKLPVPQQPQALSDALAALEQGSIEERVAKLKKKAVADLIFVKGGSFTMGDFTPLLKIPGINRMTYNEDDKYLHKVTLSDFYFSRYKATYAELNVFADAIGRPRLAQERQPEDRRSTVPAGAYWQTARDYCQWLGSITGHKFDLPTEAQWEYAARSRGQFFMIPTDDGTIEYGRNVPYAGQVERLANGSRNQRYPIGLFPSNSLGIYDMQHNGEEWVLDWYSEDAYNKSELLNPQGPSTGVRRVIRGWSYWNSLKIGVATWRRHFDPEGKEGEGRPFPDTMSPQVRCVAYP